MGDAAKRKDQALRRVEESSVTLLCGPKGEKVFEETAFIRRTDKRGVYLATFDELPGLDTWIFQVDTELEPRQVSFHVRKRTPDDDPSMEKPDRWTFLEVEDLRVGPEGDSHRPRPLPGWWTAFLAIAFAQAVYWFPVMFRWETWLPGYYSVGAAQRIDMLLVPVLLLLTLAVFWASRREQPPLIQGYLGWGVEGENSAAAVPFGRQESTK